MSYHGAVECALPFPEYGWLKAEGTEWTLKKGCPELDSQT